MPENQNFDTSKDVDVEPIAGLGSAIKAVGDTSKIVSDAAESEVGKALILPAARRLGEYWGDEMGKMINRWRQNELERLTANIKAVEAEIGFDPIEAATGDPRLPEILAGVAQADPDDEEFAAIWRATLEAAATKSKQRTRLFEIAKALSSSDVVEFSKASVCQNVIFKSKKCRHCLCAMCMPDASKRKFINLGLIMGFREDVIRKFWPNDILFNVFIFIIVSLLLPISGYIINYFIKYVSNIFGIIFIILLTIYGSFISAVAMVMYSSMASRELTSDGELILVSIRKYLKGEK